MYIHAYTYIYVYIQAHSTLPESPVPIIAAPLLVRESFREAQQFPEQAMWVVVENRVPFWLMIIIRHLLFRVPKNGP